MRLRSLGFAIKAITQDESLHGVFPILYGHPDQVLQTIASDDSLHRLLASLQHSTSRNHLRPFTMREVSGHTAACPRWDRIHLFWGKPSGVTFPMASGGLFPGTTAQIRGQGYALQR